MCLPFPMSRRFTSLVVVGVVCAIALPSWAQRVNGEDNSGVSNTSALASSVHAYVSGSISLQASAGDHPRSTAPEESPFSGKSQLFGGSMNEPKISAMSTAFDGSVALPRDVASQSSRMEAAEAHVKSGKIVSLLNTGQPVKGTPLYGFPDSTREAVWPAVRVNSGLFRFGPRSLTWSPSFDEANHLNPTYAVQLTGNSLGASLARRRHGLDTVGNSLSQQAEPNLKSNLPSDAPAIPDPLSGQIPSSINLNQPK